MMGFPNATMYPFLGVGLILDDLAHEAVAEGGASVPAADQREQRWR